MLAGKQQIGYAGDMPSIVGASKRPQRDLRIVSTLGLSTDQCGVFLTRPDAPDFETRRRHLVVRREDRRHPPGQLHRPDRAGDLRQLGVEPQEYLNQSIDVISSNFQSGKIDGAIIWEPTASRLVNAGLAKRVASGASPTSSTRASW